MSTDLETAPVILVDDDDCLREATVQALELAGLAVQGFSGAARARARITSAFAGCVVTDIRMPGMDGLELAAALRAVDAEIPVILVTGHGDVAMAVAALKDGAFDFLTKPFSSDELVASVRRALASRALVLENRELRRQASVSGEEIVGTSAAMDVLRTRVGQIAMLDLDVMIEGEGGTGKETVARVLHRRSPRALRPFVAARCSALGDGLFAAEPGGAGLIDSAAGGTLFLDEIEALPAPAQARLIAYLDTRDASPDAADRFARVVVASRAPLDEAMRGGVLREDLFYKLAVVRLRIPALRERRDDIPLLFARFVGEAMDKTRRQRFALSSAERRHLLEYDWPGNGRELRNFAYSAVLGLARGGVPVGERGAPPLAKRMAAFERTLIVEALEAAEGSVSAACSELGVSRQTLYEKIERHRIELAGLRQRR
ncbi:sigma-54-dependent transcriptional regulator [Parablastomonas sp. CN1-191]|uniref:sigma-54-dependent transcriptional regulator n=1 Tax=Parablastomonas sp. CN1-191 TaxID=3400908 RepID=UPI003BF7A92E